MIASATDNGNSSVVAQTGNTYISGTMIDSVDVSNGNSRIFDHAEFIESPPKWLWQRPTTGISNIVYQTGSTYISGTMIVSVKISTAFLGFSKKVLQMIASATDNRK